MQTLKIKVKKISEGHVPKSWLYKRYFKRILDLILSVCAIIVLSPLLAFIAVMVKVKLGSPILFKQKRPGLNEKIFTLYKFRTMTDEKDCTGCLLSDEDRLTKFGQFLRSSSIDELPELFNIVRGEMAVVGPRPLLIEYLPLYSEHQKRRHKVRPGLSGLAQINGRNAISWEDRLNYDVQYVDHLSLALDVKIVKATICKVFKREGISASSNTTMERYRGSM